jgi:osmoprotectant transport system permease protein
VSSVGAASSDVKPPEARLIDGITSWWEFMSDRPDQIWARTLEHLSLVAWAVGLATLIAVSTGILVHRIRWLRTPWLSITGVFLTIPSLALFALFIPLVGLGFRPALIALVMYAILPILRNTVTGLDGVDAAVIESAKGVGLNARQRLLRVELPLAWPVILTGVRVSSLLVTGIAAIAVLIGYGGLGFFIQEGVSRYPFPNSVERIWTGTVLTILLALVLDALIGLVQRLTTSAGLRN